MDKFRVKFLQNDDIDLFQVVLDVSFTYFTKIKHAAFFDSSIPN